MLNRAKDLEVMVDSNSNRMVIRYAPRTERTLYDLCDMNGRVLKTGVIKAAETILEITGLKGKKFVMLVVDGDQVISQRISVAA